jgi:hypothetical protein
MLIFLAAVGVAWGVGLVLPARRRVRIRARWLALPLVAALLQVALGVGGLRSLIGDSRFAIVALSYAIIGGWLIANIRYQASPLRLPAGLVAGGWALNVIPILANRGMPVSAAALARIGVRHPTMSSGNLGKHVLATSHTVLPWLGDVVAIPLPLLRNVISVGDIVVVIGVMLGIQYVDLASRAERPDKVADLVAPGPVPT